MSEEKFTNLEKTVGMLGQNVAIVGNDIGYMRTDVAEIKASILKQGDAIDRQFRLFISQADFQAHLKADEDHEMRIRALEKKITWYIGAATAVIAIVQYMFK